MGRSILEFPATPHCLLGRTRGCGSACNPHLIDSSLAELARSHTKSNRLLTWLDFKLCIHMYMGNVWQHQFHWTSILWDLGNTRGWLIWYLVMVGSQSAANKMIATSCLDFPDRMLWANELHAVHLLWRIQEPLCPLQLLLWACILLQGASLYLYLYLYLWMYLYLYLYP